MARRPEWNARTDEGGNDVYVEPLDLAGVKKPGDQLAAPIIPMCFPGMVRRRCANAFTG